MDFTIEKVAFTDELKSELLKNKLYLSEGSAYHCLLTGKSTPYIASIKCPEYIYVAKINSDIIGWSCIFEFTILFRTKSVNSVFVKSEFRFKGIGLRLFNESNLNINFYPNVIENSWIPKKMSEKIYKQNKACTA